jgi:hypothetical protein
VFGLVFFSEPLDSRRSPILRKLIKSTSAHEIRLKNDVDKRTCLGSLWDGAGAAKCH